jgi:23S rRNA (guanosine2251-2'-O)-methyltransferase
VGNENKGVSSLLIDKSDFVIKISMHGHVQSLNVSVATGILLNAVKNH